MSTFTLLSLIQHGQIVLKKKERIKKKKLRFALLLKICYVLSCGTIQWIFIQLQLVHKHHPSCIVNMRNTTHLFTL